MKDKILEVTNLNKTYHDETGEIEKESRRIDSKKLLENPYNELLNLWINIIHVT